MSVENPASKAMPVVPPDRVVVTVGDLTITAAQFDQIIEALPEQYRSVARGSGRKQFADNVVRIAVLAQEGKRRKLDESSAYRTQSMFEDANILANMTYEEISKNAKLDEADVRKYYEAHKRSSNRCVPAHSDPRAGFAVTRQAGPEDSRMRKRSPKRRISERKSWPARTSPSWPARNPTTPVPGPMAAISGASATGRWSPHSSRPLSPCNPGSQRAGEISIRLPPHQGRD